jgi:hypothetical protein
MKKALCLAVLALSALPLVADGQHRPQTQSRLKKDVDEFIRANANVQ